jgi:DNA-directed RNA polymerase I, II, and III subunit RPABC2
MDDKKPDKEESDDELSINEEDMYEDEEEVEELEKKLNVHHDKEYKQIIQTENIIVKPEDRILSEYLTEYEMCNILSTRAKHIEDGAAIYVDVGNLKDPIEIAQKEIMEKKCPLSILREIKKGLYEIWHINEMIPPMKKIKD